MLGLFDKLKKDLILLDEALPSGKWWEGREVRKGYEQQAAFVASARPLALAVTQVCRNFLEGPLTEALREARGLQKHDKLLARLLESRIRKLMSEFERMIVEAENGAGAKAIEDWLDELAREVAAIDEE